MTLLRQGGNILLAQQCCCDCFPACLPTGTKLNTTISGITASQGVVNPCGCDSTGIVTVDLTALNGAYVLRNVVSQPKNRFFSAGACDGNNLHSGPCNADLVRASGFPALVTVIPGDCDCTEYREDRLSWLEVDLDCDRETGQMFIADCLFVIQCSIYKLTDCIAVPPADTNWHCWTSYYGFGSGGQYPNSIPDQFQVLDTAKACKEGGSFLHQMRTQVKWPLLESFTSLGCDFIQQSTSFNTGFIIATLDFS
jgi:hypothetical protein